MFQLCRWSSFSTHSSCTTGSSIRSASTGLRACATSIRQLIWCCPSLLTGTRNNSPPSTLKPTLHYPSRWVISGVIKILSIQQDIELLKWKYGESSLIFDSLIKWWVIEHTTLSIRLGRYIRLILYESCGNNASRATCVAISFLEYLDSKSACKLGRFLILHIVNHMFVYYQVKTASVERMYVNGKQCM